MEMKQTAPPIPPTTIIACGALANELVALKSLNNWAHLEITCLPAKYHQTPALIPDAVRKKIKSVQAKNHSNILVAYGDCGTGGMLDKVLDETGTQRLPGAHCYQFFAGHDRFNELHEAEIGTFYLTDFLTQHFETYVWKALGLDRKPELLEMYFGNYKKLVYLAQTDNDALTIKGKECAQRLGLEYERIVTEYGEMESELKQFIDSGTFTSGISQPASQKTSPVTEHNIINVIFENYQGKSKETLTSA